MSRAVVIPGKGIKTEELVHSAQIISALEILNLQTRLSFTTLSNRLSFSKFLQVSFQCV